LEKEGEKYEKEGEQYAKEAEKDGPQWVAKEEKMLGLA